MRLRVLASFLLLPNTLVSQRPDLAHPDERVRTHLDNALQAWRARNYEGARALYDSALIYDPQSTYGLMGRARARLELGDSAGAAQDFRTAGNLGLSPARSWADLLEDTRAFVTAPGAKYVGMFLLLCAVLMGAWVWRTAPGEIPEFALQDGERPRWIGSPKPGFTLHGIDVLRIPASIGFAAVVISTWQQEVGANGLEVTPYSIAYLGVFAPLAATAIFWLFGRFFEDARRRKQTLYAITNQRAIAVVGKRTPRRLAPCAAPAFFARIPEGEQVKAMVDEARLAKR